MADTATHAATLAAEAKKRIKGKKKRKLPAGAMPIVKYPKMGGADSYSKGRSRPD